MRVAFQGAVYSYALPDGTSIVERNGAIESSTDGRIPRGDMLAIQAKRYKGQLYLAGQGHDDGFCWLWSAAGGWKSLGQSYGVRPCAFGSDSLYWAYSGDSIRRLNLDSGEVSTITVGSGVGSQGIRYVEGDRIYRGDDTLFDGTVHEFIDRGDVRVGQGHSGGCLVNGRLLEPGDCQFITFERDGDRLAIAIVKFLEGQSVLHYLTRAEVDLLPLPPTTGGNPEIPPQNPPNTPIEPKPEPPKPMPSYTGNPTDALKALRATFPTPLGAKHGEFLIAACRTVGHGAGLLQKESGTFVTLPSGRKVSQDWMVFPDGFGTDFLSDGEGAANVGWGQLQEYDKSRYVDISGEVIGTPEPPKPQPQPDYQKQIDELRALGAEHESALKDALTVIESLMKRVATLEDKARTLPKLRVRGNTSRDWGHSHRIDLDVVPE